MSDPEGLTHLPALRCLRSFLRRTLRATFLASHLLSSDEDSSKYAERSSLHGLVQAQIPLMVVHAELDPDLFQQGARQLNEALCKAGRCPRFVALAKHSHMSEGYAINTKDTSLSGEVQAFVAKK